MKLLKRPIINIVTNHLIDYPTPINLSYLWSFGFTAAFCLGVQMNSPILAGQQFPSTNSALLCFSPNDFQQVSNPISFLHRF